MYFSCIITCYNREQVIENSINSIINQTFQNFEIIVVDDCSKDESISRIEGINDSRIKIVRHQVNLGQNTALNSGVRASKFEYLAFLDSDDVWLPNYLQEMQQTYVSNPNVAFVYCSLINGPLWTLEGENKYADVLNQGYLSSMISITAKKSAVVSINGFDPRYTICQDDDFCFRLAQRYSFSVIRKQLAEVYGTTDSMTRNMVKVAQGWDFLFNDYKKDILELCGAKSFSRHTLNVAIQYFNCNRFLSGLRCYINGIFFFVKPSYNKFPFSGTEFIATNKIIFLLFVRKIKRAITN